MKTDVKGTGGKLILLYFVAFFGVIIAVNVVFMYFAVTTFTGLVTEDPYEKGLAYNKVLEKAKAQPKLIQNAVYENGVLRWSLSDEDNISLDSAAVTAQIMRPVKSGFDFEVKLEYKGGNIYEAKLDLPMHGAWVAKLSAKWDKKQYQTTYNFVAKN